jgi:SAM-dependent methyltransferase
MASKSRMESNQWLKKVAKNIKGDVLSIGAMQDIDCEGDVYRHYFKKADSYITSDIEGNVEMLLDVRDMSIIPDRRYNCVFCAGVLEHVDDFMAGMREITRILTPGGILLLGVPFRQAIHSFPYDYWRFTRFGLEYMLRDKYVILEIKELDDKEENFPATYWVRAIKK